MPLTVSRRGLMETLLGGAAAAYGLSCKAHADSGLVHGRTVYYPGQGQATWRGNAAGEIDGFQWNYDPERLKMDEAEMKRLFASMEPQEIAFRNYMTRWIDTSLKAGWL